MWRAEGSKPALRIRFFQQLYLAIARRQLSVLVVGKVGRGLRIRCITSSNLEMALVFYLQYSFKIKRKAIQIVWLTNLTSYVYKQINT